MQSSWKISIYKEDIWILWSIPSLILTLILFLFLYTVYLKSLNYLKIIFLTCSSRVCRSYLKLTSGLFIDIFPLFCLLQGDEMYLQRYSIQSICLCNVFSNIEGFNNQCYQNLQVKPTECLQKSATIENNNGTSSTGNHWKKW